MAERRMFSRKITDSDAFLDMPLSTQCLYFHLSMVADDDGFVNNSKKVMRTIGASDDDLKLLLAKSYLIKFENEIYVIKHWWLNNWIRSDRKVGTSYQEYLDELDQKEDGTYTLKYNVNEMSTECQHRLDKVSIDKYRLGKVSNIRHKHGEYKHVLLTDEQYQKLLEDLGESKLAEYIKKVDEYCQQYGKSYKDYNLTIRKWFKNDHKEANDDYSNIITNYDTSNNPKLDLDRFKELEEKRCKKT